MTRQLRCDFCPTGRPTWSVPCASFRYEPLVSQRLGIEGGSSGPWLACGPCTAMVLARDLDGLVAQANANAMRRMGLDLAKMAMVGAAHRALYEAFFKHMIAEPRAITDAERARWEQEDTTVPAAPQIPVPDDWFLDGWAYPTPRAAQVAWERMDKAMGKRRSSRGVHVWRIVPSAEGVDATQDARYIVALAYDEQTRRRLHGLAGAGEPWEVPESIASGAMARVLNIAQTAAQAGATRASGRLRVPEASGGAELRWDGSTVVPVRGEG